MFLFTSTPRQTEPAKADHPLARPFQAASEATGVPFDYLMQTAKRESNLNPQAKASTSTATGLFQFLEQTWLGLIKKDGAQLGLQAEAEAISQDRSGRFSVPDAKARQQILELRKDPELSARAAGVFTQKNKDVLRDQLKREPNAGELYMAHFLGAQGASDLIGLAMTNPGQSAARVFPDAAAANRPIFFDGKGRARTTREVYARLAAFHSGGDTAPATTIAANMPATSETGSDGTSTRSPLALVPSRLAAAGATPRTNIALHGLFRNGADSASANILRKTWGGFAEARLNRDAPSFFPRSEGVKVAALNADAVMSPGVPPSASDARTKTDPEMLAGFEAMVPDAAPLPPRRPEAGRGSASGGPFDLLRFLKFKR